MVLRRFNPRDLPGILRIERESFDRDAWPREVFLEYASSANVLFLVSCWGGRIAGYILALMTKGGAEIASLAVRSAYRKEGIATKLLKAAMKRVWRDGARAIWLMVRRDNKAAIRLYRRFGFVRTSTVPSYYDDGAPGWRMRISIDDSRSPDSY